MCLNMVNEAHGEMGKRLSPFIFTFICVCYAHIHVGMYVGASTHMCAYMQKPEVDTVSVTVLHLILISVCMCDACGHICATAHVWKSGAASMLLRMCESVAASMPLRMCGPVTMFAISFSLSTESGIEPSSPVLSVKCVY